MKLFERVSKLVKTHIRGFLNPSEDFDEEIASVLNGLERATIEVQQETVRAMAREKELERHIRTEKESSDRWNKEVRLALERGDEVSAKHVLSQRLASEKKCERLEKELLNTAQTVAHLKSDLYDLKKQLQTAREKKEELKRREHLARSRLRAREATEDSAEDMNALSSPVSSKRHTPSRAFESYEDTVIRMEAQAEAERIVSELFARDRSRTDSLIEEEILQKELEKLRKEKDKT